MPSPAVYQGICACYAGGVGALQFHGGYSSLSCVPVPGRPVGSGRDAVLDSAPAYPLSDHMGAPWSVWSVLWRLRLLCPRRSHIPFCGHLVCFWLYIYWSVFAVPLWCVPLWRLHCYVRRRLHIPDCGHHVWSWIFTRCFKVGRQHVGSGIHEVLIGATVCPMLLLCPVTFGYPCLRSP